MIQMEQNILLAPGRFPLKKGIYHSNWNDTLGI
jgi:hypothetical protein